MGISNVSAQQNISSGERTFDAVRRLSVQKIPTNTVDKTPESDTVEIGTKDKSSKYKKAALAIIGTVLAGIGIYALTKGKNKNALKKCEEKAEQALKEGENNTGEALKKGEQKVKSETEQEAEKKLRKAEEELNAAKKKEEEARIKAEQEARAKAEQEAKLKAEQEAKTKAEAEAKKAEEEARIKAEQEAKAAEQKQKQIERQKKFEWSMDTSEKYVKEHMEELDKLLLDKDGKIAESCVNSSSPRYSFDDLFRPYKGNASEFYHATTPEAKAKILEEGFNQRLAPTHGYLNGVGGSYFAVNKNALADGGYGSDIITARFNGKIAEFNPNLVDNIKCGNSMNVWKKLQDEGMSPEEANELSEMVVLRYLQEKLFAKGFKGVITSEPSHMAGCHYFSALDPKLIQIIK